MDQRHKRGMSCGLDPALTALADSLAALPTEQPCHRLADFKAKPSSQDEDERRARWLAAQKERRRDTFNLARRLALGSDCDDDDDDDEDIMEEDAASDPSTGDGTASTQMDTAGDVCAQGDSNTAGKPAVGGTKKVRKNLYRNQLMLSEWMKNVPTDIVEHWAFCVCPVGKRCLVVASRGTTAAYRRSGSVLARFPSTLPGGARHRRGTPQEYALLDCVFDEIEGIFYVLDLLCWRGVPILDSDVDFRNYWTMTKFEEDYGHPERNRMNPYLFVPLPKKSCTPDNLIKATAFAYPYAVDGFLFYHREGRYVPGVVPLVTWLKPEMLPDAFGVTMPTCVTHPYHPGPKVRLPPFAAPLAPPSVHWPVHDTDAMES